MLEETGISLDRAIAEEFRGTANMELYMDGAGRMDFQRSMTRNAASMLDEKRQAAYGRLHQQAAEQGSEAFAAFLDDLLNRTENNGQLIDQLG